MMGERAVVEQAAAWVFVSGGFSQAGFYPVNYCIQTNALFEVGENKRPVGANLPGVSLHHFERGADKRGEVNLVDQQQIRTQNAGAALARHLVAGGYVQYIDPR